MALGGVCTPTSTVCRRFSDSARNRFLESVAATPPPKHPRLVPASARSGGKPPKGGSSVLIPLVQGSSGRQILFTQRAIHLRGHRGEVCFPGGRLDEGETMEQAALRETHEEIGIPLEAISVWGTMHGVMNRHLTDMVIPVVGVVDEAELARMRVNDHEVHAVFSVSVEELCRNVRYTHFRAPKFQYTLPVFCTSEYKMWAEGEPAYKTTGATRYRPREYRIWGLSAVMLHQCLTHIAPHLYTPPVRVRFF